MFLLKGKVMDNLDKFFVYGINHNDLNLLEREKFVIDFKPYKLMRKLIEEKKVEDCLIISTCLRNEFYFWNEKENIKEYFQDIKGVFFKSGLDAINHLFRVSCGFDSQIPGEEQILAQVKKAYIDKIEKGERPSPLNSIFNKAIALGKKFRTISKINENSVSVEALGIKEAEKIYEDIVEKNIFIIGAGEISSSLVKILYKKGCRNINVLKRRKSMILEAVNYYSFDEKVSLFYDSDIVFGTTSAPHTIIELDELEVEKVKSKKRLIVDFAVPRDFDYKIGNIENQILVNLEELNSKVEKSYENRCTICEEYNWLIDKGVEKVVEWFERRGI